MREIVVNSNEAGQRMDKLLAKVLNQCSKSFLYKMLRKKNIKLNNNKAQGNEILVLGDKIQIYFSDATFDKFSQKEEVHRVILPDRFQVIYEDTDIVLMNKWAGVLSQKAKAEDISMNEYLIEYALRKDHIRPEDLKTFTPSISNRLDYNTSGILAGGITLKGLQCLAKGFKDRTIEKYYYALVVGEVTESMRIEAYLRKEEKSNKVTVVTDVKDITMDGFQPIKTEYEVVKHRKEASLLRVHLITGKTHQIRAHLRHIGHPIIGDGKYGEFSVNQYYHEKYGIHGQMLHAKELYFPEDFALSSVAGKHFTAPLPSLYERVLGSLF